ncbi:uncharacterized protein LOC124172318 isoform X3 [Ischnura elegans]|uniref:uncharacterized protein LOC124172318 isoform X3 n=1 Tax=Ischnura elegans TaxID=197161 RepID=UPI001ED88B33|nr:uncharacterized protein LOC124172318 isoform X3 [Ischnura elegans]
MALVNECPEDSSKSDSESTLCRLCMKNHDYYVNIFTSNVKCKVAVKDVLLDLVGLKVAVGDGLPATVCPLCLKKLMEFSDFKKICYKSDAELRKLSSSIDLTSIKEEGSADDESGFSPETSDSIQNVSLGTSQNARAVNMTEIYIPVPDCQLPNANMLFNVKEEEEDQLEEENYHVLDTEDAAGISSNASDPLATAAVSTSAENAEPMESYAMADEDLTEAVDVTIETDNACTSEETVSINDDSRVAELIKSEFRRLNSRIESIENTVLVLVNGAQVGRGKGTVCETALNNLPSFPLDSLADLRKVEAELQKSDGVRKQFKLKIKLIGGMSGEQHFRRALTHLLSNDLAYQLTWMAPQHGSRKRGHCTDSVYFSALMMCDVLIASVMECHPTSSSVASLERVGKQWLQHAGDRLKYAEKKRR